MESIHERSKELSPPLLKTVTSRHDLIPVSASDRYPHFRRINFPQFFLSDDAAVAAPSCRSLTISPWRSVVGVSVVELEEVMTILELHRQGLSISAIVARLGMDRKTIRKYIENGVQRLVTVPERRDRASSIHSSTTSPNAYASFPT